MGSIPTRTHTEPTVTLDGYAVDAYVLTRRQRAVVDRLAGGIRSRLDGAGSNQVTVLIDGHTDATGTERYNEGLGLRRASAVEAAFREGLVTVSDRVGYRPRSAGEVQPVAPNWNARSRARNRRVELALRWETLDMPPDRPAPVRPPRRRSRPTIFRPTPADCIDLDLLERRFGRIWDRLERTLIDTDLTWEGEGEPVTIKVTDKTVYDDFAADVRDMFIDDARGFILRADVAFKVFEAVQLAQDLSRDVRNRGIMGGVGRLADLRRQDLHRRLVARFVAEAYARESPGTIRDVGAFYIAIWQLWERIGALSELCNRARGAGQSPTIGHPSPEADLRRPR